MKFIWLIFFTLCSQLSAKAYDCRMDFSGENCSSLGGTLYVINCGPEWVNNGTSRTGYIPKFCIVPSTDSRNRITGTLCTPDLPAVNFSAAGELGYYGDARDNIRCTPDATGSVPPPSSTLIYPPSHNSCTSGSIINTDSQVLTEIIPLVGVPYVLTYTSDRVDGYQTWWQTKIPYTAADFIPDPSVKSFRVSLLATSSNASNFSTDIASPTDAGAHYFMYTAPKTDSTGTRYINSYSTTTDVNKVNPNRLLMPLGQVVKVSSGTLYNYSSTTGIGASIGVPVLTDYGLGGWELSIHHHYDSQRKLLFLGSGSITSGTQIALADGSSLVASADGSELYQLSSGHHVKTISGLTGATKYTFIYDSSKPQKLQKVIDAFGNTVTFVYGQSGLTGITAPFGQMTKVTRDASGMIASVTSPSSEVYAMTYYAQGLLHTFQKPSGVMSTMTYDSNGLLTSDTNSEGSATNLSVFSNLDGSKTVTEKSALGRITTHAVPYSPTFYTRTDSAPDGTIITHLESKDAISDRENNDYYSSINYANDPRFGQNVRYIFQSAVGTGNSSRTIQTIKTVNGLSAIRSPILRW